MSPALAPVGERDTGDRTRGLDLAVLGAPDARLFAGPNRSSGRETYAEHARRLGPLLFESLTPAALRERVRASGLLGRGGGEFPLATKLETAVRAPGVPLVVANCSEGEPASRKDKTLIEMRPHLVLDGALAAAHAVGAKEIVIYLHANSLSMRTAIEEALGERTCAQPISLVEAPARYVAGESSAVVSFLDGTGALPRRRAQPVAEAGVRGRPSVVSNAETLAHLALIARFGAAFFRGAGEPAVPGSTLVTLAGDVAVPGVVVEVLRPTPLASLLSTVGGLDERPQAVLVGGYAGTWLEGRSAWQLPIGRAALRGAGAGLGCGLIAPLRAGACGLATTARLVAYLASQSAGQCGSCVFGLAQIAELFSALSVGEARRRDLRRLHELSALVAGRGGCGHPSGVATLVESALDTFAAEVDEHLHGAGCRASESGFPLPAGPIS